MEERIIKISKKFSEQMKNLYGKHFKKLIIYGSYARGDYNENSDLDLAVIVDTSFDKIVEDKETNNKLIDYAYDLTLENELEINPLVINEAMLEKRATFWPFYTNVKKEGVDVSGL